MRFAAVLVMAGLVPEAVKTWMPAPNPPDQVRGPA